MFGDNSCFFCEKDFLKISFGIYYAIAIYRPLVGQKKFGIFLDHGMVDGQENFGLFLVQILLLAKEFLNFRGSHWLVLHLLLSTFIKWILSEKIAEIF